MKKLSKITLQVIGGANIASIVLMLVIGHADIIQPVNFPRLSNLGMLFPVTLFINVAFLIFWAFVRLRMVIIPVIGLVLCFGPIRRYIPINIAEEPPKGSIKVLSYNVMNFAWSAKEERYSSIMEYIKLQDADLVLLQEAAMNAVAKAQYDSLLKPVYHYADTVQRSTDVVTLLSKYPILTSERIDFRSKGNLSAAFIVRIKGRDVLVVNNHLETTGLSPEERQKFSRMMKGELESDTVKATSKWLIGHLGEQTRKRAPQADAVARYIAYHSDMPVIVGGDFNDTPISYAHRVIAQGLTDCYVSSGLGPGFSYHRSAIYVRIDNLLCSSHFEPYGCHVDKSIDRSDHYPLIGWLSLKK